MPTQQNQFWQRTDRGIVIDKLRNTITLESFGSLDCGEFSTNSARLVSNGVNQDLIGHIITNNTDPIDAVTVEAWIKLTRFPTTGNYASIFHRDDATYLNSQINFSVNSFGCLVFTLKQGGNLVSLTTSDLKIDINQWIFVTASWDGTTMCIFKDGVKDSNTQALNGTLDVNVVSPANYMGVGVVNTRKSFNGWIAEVRIWNTGRTRQDILNTMFGPRNYNTGSGIDDGLIYYYKCNEGTGPESGPSVASFLTEWVTSETASVGLNNGGSLTTDEGPPLKYGASFVIANYDCVLDLPCSLKFPIKAPRDANFALVIRWEDDEGDIQRRFLWTVDGVEIAPIPAKYRGERLPLEFTFEVWNIDGQPTVDMSDDLVIETSIKTNPLTSIDIDQPSLADLTCNAALSSLFPFTFPVLFNTIPTFILPSSAAPPIPTNVGNVLGESGSVLGEGSTGLQ